MWKSICAAVKSGLEIASKIPVSGMLKVGILIGATVFTAWVLIRHTKKMHEIAYDDCDRYSPVDEILHNNYCTDPDAFDDMDPEAKKICKKMNRIKRKSKNRKKNSAKSSVKNNPHVRTVSIFDDDNDEKEDTPKPKKDILFYDDASSMMMDDHAKKSKKKKHKKIHLKNARNDKIRTIRDDIADWQAGGFSAQAAQDKVDQVARELGFEVDEYADDDRIPQSVQDKCSALF